MKFLKIPPLQKGIQIHWVFKMRTKKSSLNSTCACENSHFLHTYVCIFHIFFHMHSSVPFLKHNANWPYDTTKLLINTTITYKLVFMITSCHACSQSHATKHPTTTTKLCCGSGGIFPTNHIEPQLEHVA